MWITAWIITDSPTYVTFSDMLALDTPQGQVIQNLYLICWGFNNATTLAIILIILRYYINDIEKNHPPNEKPCVHHHEHCLLFTFKWMYVFCAIGKAIGFLGLYYFPVTTESEIHYGYAITAFILSIVSIVVLFIRRVFINTRFTNIAYDPETGKKTWSFWIRFIFNLLFILTMIGMAISMIAVNCGGHQCKGVYEFVMCNFIWLDPVWMIYDLATEPDPYLRYFYKSPATDMIMIPIKARKDYIDKIYEKVRQRFRYNKV